MFKREILLNLNFLFNAIWFNDLVKKKYSGSNIF